MIIINTDSKVKLARTLMIYSNSLDSKQISKATETIIKQLTTEIETDNSNINKLDINKFGMYDYLKYIFDKNNRSDFDNALK
ncbi:MAG: hypothetical protein ACI8WT_003933 [Clostridium sp.]|jgi:hypothetical protein